MYRALSVTVVMRTDEADKFKGFVDARFFDKDQSPDEKTLYQSFDSEESMYTAMEAFLDNLDTSKLLTTKE